ncbi:MAG: HEAT repeat domain-containing protein [Planctomycetes bacterium]|nr:HEAT repeat domain-containing protein [Planctomycetota bacterium]
MAQLQMQEPEQRRAGIVALSEHLSTIRDPISTLVLQPMIQRLDDPAPKVRQATVNALGSFTYHPEVGQALRNRLAMESQPEVRQQLQALLADGTNPSLPTPPESKAGPSSPAGRSPPSIKQGTMEAVPTIEAGSLGVGMEQLTARYRAALPQLLQQHRGQWIALRASERIIDSDPHKVVEACSALGWREGEFLLCHIEPDVQTEIDI